MSDDTDERPAYTPEQVAAALETKAKIEMWAAHCAASAEEWTKYSKHSWRHKAYQFVVDQIRSGALEVKP